MAIALNTNLGANSNSSGSTVTLSTAGAVASGATVFLLVSWWNDVNSAATASGGGLTWTKDTQTDNGSGDRFAIFSAPAPAGLASATTLTITFGTADGGHLIGGVSFTGVGSIDTTGGTTGSGTGWSSGTATNAVDGALALGGAGGEEGASTTSVAVIGTELHDRWQSGALQGFATGFQVVSGTGSRSITGTFSRSSTANTGALAIYSPSGGATVAATLTLPTFQGAF